MFGKKKDFFGVQYLRYKAANDQEKQHKIEQLKQSLSDDAKIEDLFVEKDVFFGNIIKKRGILSKRDVHFELYKDKYDKVTINHVLEEIIQNFIRHDRVDAILRLQPALSPSQRRWSNSLIEAHEKNLSLPASPSASHVENQVEENVLRDAPLPPPQSPTAPVAPVPTEPVASQDTQSPDSDYPILPDLE